MYFGDYRDDHELTDEELERRSLKEMLKGIGGNINNDDNELENIRTEIQDCYDDIRYCEKRIEKAKSRILMCEKERMLLGYKCENLVGLLDNETRAEMLKNQIDLALDFKDKDRFIELTKQLKEIETYN